MAEYKLQPNSHKYRAEQAEKAKEEKRVVNTVGGAITTKKKNGIHKFADTFISEDAKNVKSYFIDDIIVPTIKKALLGALDMVLNGGNGGGYTHRDTASKVSYRSYYDDRDSHRRDTRVNTRFDYDEIVFRDRGVAERVIDSMADVIDRYGFVTVADLYDIAELSAPPYTGNRYGWTSLRTAEAVKVREGWILKLPKASPID